jgi:hypothetical protein
MSELSVAKLQSWSACPDGVAWFSAQKLTDGKKVAMKLVKEKQLDWANWLVARLLGRKDKIRYAIFAAEQVIGMYEKQYPDDKRPRLAIEAARVVLKHDTEANRSAAHAAAHAAHAAVYAADAAYAAADEAARAVAYAAARAAAYAAAYAAARAAYVAAYAVADEAARAAAYAAADATYAAMKTKIINYGIGLLR